MQSIIQYSLKEEKQYYLHVHSKSGVHKLFNLSPVFIFIDHLSNPWGFIEPLDDPIDHWGSISTTLRTPAVSVIANYGNKLFKISNMND